MASLISFYTAPVLQNFGSVGEYQCHKKTTPKNSSVLNKCIIFGFPGDSDVIEVINYCVLYAKYYIYIQRLYNNNKLDLFGYMTQLKFAMEIESKICKSQNNEKKFAKYNFIYENL